MYVYIHPNLKYIKHSVLKFKFHIGFLFSMFNSCVIINIDEKLTIRYVTRAPLKKSTSPFKPSFMRRYNNTLYQFCTSSNQLLKILKNTLPKRQLLQHNLIKCSAETLISYNFFLSFFDLFSLPHCHLYKRINREEVKEFNLGFCTFVNVFMKTGN